ncbi:VWA domain-containing protein [Arthrobacter sp. ISL-72]|uniref:vWA domain-containing protein n=1 Tax=Arthrobacter sp. ISL-72 TaxID=2819114 RepID=UPI001BE8DE3F|nr:VWA domain-containing protein [Arthrobacter sp. ISL-72]MBT2594807.1 VWA domain-containing protein [Arthrobacter sp. ISL-72]
MELIFWWMIPVALLLAGATYWALRKGPGGDESVPRPVAHSHRLTELPEYQAAVRRHRRWLTVAAVAGGVAMAAAVVAAARPAERSTVSPEQRNRDIILCLDASGSMSSADAAVAEVFARLAQGFDGERLGLTVFDSSAVQVIPLTDDYDYVQEQLKVAKEAFDGTPGSAGFLDGTWNGAGSSLIGDGLASCVQGFPATGALTPGGTGRTEERSRSVILATDNFVSGEPIFTLEEAGSLARKQGVRVYALNPGDFDYGTDPEQPGAKLRAVAEGTGGAYYPLDSPEAAADIIRRVQSTEATAFSAAPQAAVSDRAEIPLGIALVSGLVLAGATWRLRR